MLVSPKFRLAAALFFLLVVSWFSFLNHLESEPMHLWDESSYALNAQEMVETGNPIEVFLFGKPDFYNSKPPFAIWCMAVSIQVLGFNELGVRLPSALFGLAAVLGLFWIGYKVFKNEWLALSAPLVLASSTGFIGEHITRTGDTDGILAFWILMQSCCIFLYSQSQEPSKQNRYLLVAWIMFSLGCLTKGIAGCIALPGLLAWLGYQKKVGSLFRSKTFYLGVFIFSVSVPGYYLLREVLNPGYLAAVFNFEVGGRLAQQEYLNPEYRPFYYFYQSMLDEGRLATWIYLLPAAILFILFSPNGPKQKLGLFLVFALVGVSFTLGLSKTKLFWYDAPLYPLIAGVIGIAVALMLERSPKIYLSSFLVIFVFPYSIVVMKNIYPEVRTHFPAFLSELRLNGQPSDSLLIINADPNFPLHFYVKQDEMNGYYSKLVHPNDEILKPGNLIITEKYAREVDVNIRFTLDTLQSYYECNLYKIVGLK
jgi:4-amino-4-deoxy-L-arabinose transferase-like glycosyltransferase